MLSLDSPSSRIYRTNKFHAVILGGFSAITNNIKEETDITLVSLAAVFLDVTQRSPKRGRALRDIQKTAARETNITKDDFEFGLVLSSIKPKGG